jgi:hypothetical protein
MISEVFFLFFKNILKSSYNKAHYNYVTPGFTWPWSTEFTQYAADAYDHTLTTAAGVVGWVQSDKLAEFGRQFEMMQAMRTTRASTIAEAKILWPDLVRLTMKLPITIDDRRVNSKGFKIHLLWSICFGKSDKVWQGTFRSAASTHLLCRLFCLWSAQLQSIVLIKLVYVRTVCWFTLKVSPIVLKLF